MTIDRGTSGRLSGVVAHLASDIGPRNIYHYPALCRAADHLELAFRKLGYSPVRQTYEVDGRIFSNLIAERRGEGLASEILILGAHYDTHKDSPGANDNGSAIAAVLELAREARDWRIALTLRFVLFTNEESPFTRTEHMGSLIYAQACRANNEKIAGMLCLETLGCYSEDRVPVALIRGSVSASSGQFPRNCERSGVAAVAVPRHRHTPNSRRIAVSGFELAEAAPGGSKLRSLVILEEWIPGCDDDRYCASAVSTLSFTRRYSR